jgi:fumarylacetoacetase
MIDDTHNPTLVSCVESANQPATDFPIQNLPYASFRSHGTEGIRLGVGIGERVLDVSGAFKIPSMLTVMAMPREERIALRRQISQCLTTRSGDTEQWLLPMDKVELLLPCEIPDYTDFYASIHHATNVGRMFRPDYPLLPNY